MSWNNEGDFRDCRAVTKCPEAKTVAYADLVGREEPLVGPIGLMLDGLGELKKERQKHLIKPSGPPNMSARTGIPEVSEATAYLYHRQFASVGRPFKSYKQDKMPETSDASCAESSNLSVSQDIQRL